MTASVDRIAFFKAWISDPLRVASVMPSSDRLADLITRDIGPARGPVLELGPGTGVFTQALLRRGVRPQDLTLVEMGAEFAAMLALRYPDANLLQMDASRLSTLRPTLRPCVHAAAISGLPLLSMSTGTVMRILVGTFKLLAPGAGFYQFTYGWRCPVANIVLDRLGLEASRVGSVVRNLPPASVYCISRRARAA